MEPRCLLIDPPVNLLRADSFLYLPADVIQDSNVHLAALPDAFNLFRVLDDAAGRYHRSPVGIFLQPAVKITVALLVFPAALAPA